MKRTQWYSADQKPAFIGIFERRYNKYDDEYGARYCFFDGELFGLGEPTPTAAIKNYMHYGPSLNQSLPWRGVAK